MKLLPILIFVAGCGAAHSTGNDLGGTCDPAVYPCGPYGYATGSVMQNLSLTGRRDLNMNGSPLDDAVQTISLSDYFQNQTNKVLFISLATVWCVPCGTEQPSLVTLYNNYKQSHPGQVAFLEVILQNAQAQPADTPTVDAWTMNYKIPFDMASDPMNVLAPFYNPNTFPVQLILTTSNMSIIYDHTGSSTDLQSVIDGALAQP